jgi:hypothetical protein
MWDLTGRKSVDVEAIRRDVDDKRHVYESP